jgi:hypothetical protein
MTISVDDDGSVPTEWVNRSLKHAQRLLKKYPEYQIRLEDGGI